MRLKVKSVGKLLEDIKMSHDVVNEQIIFKHHKEGRNSLDALCQGVERFVNSGGMTAEGTPTWDELYIAMVRLVAMKSKDSSTKCGCVIVGPDHEVRSTGYNGLPRGVEYREDRTEVRPEKYFWFEHSERNAIYNAARMGLSLKGCTAYVTGPPCADCARGLIQAGIKEVVIPTDVSQCAIKNKDKWGDSCDRAQKMFAESGVTFRRVEGT